MKITSIQTDICWENIDGNLDQLTKIFKTIPPSDLVILPEMFTTGFTMNVQKVAAKKEDKLTNIRKGKVILVKCTAKLNLASE